MEDLGKLKVTFETQKKEELASFLASGDTLEFEKHKTPMISVILILYNRAELTLACLKSLSENCTLPIEIIVIDNKSTDDTEKLFEQVKGVVYIRNEENKNFLLGCNQASEHAHGKYLLFLNNDAVIRENAIENALNVFQEEDNVGAVGAKIILLDGKLQEAGSITWNDGSCLGYGRGHDPDKFEYNYRRKVNFCSGAFLLTPFSLFKKMGLFDTEYAPAYYEETDYCLNLQENGYDIYYEPTSVIDHFEFASSAKQSSAIKLQRKNQETFLKKHDSYLSSMFVPDLNNVLFARQINDKPKILFVDDRVPHQDLGAGFPRSNQIINLMIDLGYDVSVWSLNFIQEDTWDNIYRDINPKVELVLGYTREFIDEFIYERKSYYDLIWVSRPHNMEFLYDRLGQFKDVKVIYDAEAIFSDRAVEKAKLNGDHIDEEEALKNELDLAVFADTVVTVKEADKDNFIDNNFENVHILNVSFDSQEYINPFNQRRDLLFVGNMDYDDSPNVDSIVWFIENVFPHVKRAIPDCKINLVGTNKSGIIQRYGKHNKDVILHGRVNDLTEIYNANKIFLAPTRYAAGSPAKVFMAAAFGIPIIATQLILDQVGWEVGDCIDGCHHDDPEQFAEILIKVYNDEMLWNRISKNSLNKIKSENGLEAYTDKLDIILAETLDIEVSQRKTIKQISFDEISNDKVKLIYEKIAELKNENAHLNSQIREGEKYVLKLLNEIKNKDLEIVRRGEVIAKYNESIGVKLYRNIKKPFQWLGRRFNFVFFYSKNALRFFWVFISNPMATLRHLNKENLSQLIQALKNEPFSIVLNNIAKKFNT